MSKVDGAETSGREPIYRRGRRPAALQGLRPITRLDCSFRSALSQVDAEPS